LWSHIFRPIRYFPCSLYCHTQMRLLCWSCASWWFVISLFFLIVDVIHGF
jgi:hypothetical protein